MTIIYCGLVAATHVLNNYLLFSIIYFAPPYDQIVPEVVVEMDVEVAVTKGCSVVDAVVVRAVDVVSTLDAIVVLTP